MEGPTLEPSQAASLLGLSDGIFVLLGEDELPGSPDATGVLSVDLEHSFVRTMFHLDGFMMNGLMN